MERSDQEGPSLTCLALPLFLGVKEETLALGVRRVQWRQTFIKNKNSIGSGSYFLNSLKVNQGIKNSLCCIIILS